MKLLLLACILFTSCCASKQKANAVVENSANIQNDSNVILFVVLKINTDSILNKNKVELISKTKSTGKLKEKNFESANAQYRQALIIDILENDKLINTIVIEHPLYKHLEYVGDDNRFATKDVVLTQSDFFIRFKLNGVKSKMRISEKIKDNKPQELTTIEL